MFRNESEFRDHIASLLQKEGIIIEQREFRVPEGYRVDLLAIKDDSRIGMEIKLDRRGIADDISKASILNKLPEFDYIYVAAPKIHLNSELVSYAKQVKIGLVGVTETSIEWLQESEKLEPAVLGGKSSLPQQTVTPGSIFEVTKDVRNVGHKVARHLEMFFVPSGPFVTMSGEKPRFQRASLFPQDSWEIQFKIKVKSNAREGTYPLFLGCTAEDLEPANSTWDIKISSSD